MGLLLDTLQTASNKGQAAVYLAFLTSALLHLALTKVFFELVIIKIMTVVLLCYAFSSRLEQAWASLRSGKIAYFGELRLSLHYRYSVGSLRFLLDLNRLYGAELYAFLLLLYPENATMWMVTLFRKPPLSPHFRIVIASTSLMAILCSTALHYKAVGLTSRMADSGRYLASVASRSRSIQALRGRIRLDRYVSLFHSQTSPHTVSYGRHGNVTSSSFSKVKCI